MTFPVIESVADDHNETGNSTTHTVDLPAGIRTGELLLIFAVSDGLDAQSAPIGWKRAASETSSPVTNIWYKKAVGDEGSSITITTVAGQVLISKAYRISGAADPDIYPPEAAHAGASSAAANAPSLSTSWNSEDTLWLSLVGVDTTGIIFTTFPRNFTDTGSFDADGGAGVTLAYCQKESHEQTIDPTAYAQSNEQWNAWTVAIRPKFDGLHQQIQRRNFLLASAAETTGMVVRKIPWTIKPPLGTPLDYGNSLCRGLLLVDTFQTDKSFDLTRKHIDDGASNKIVQVVHPYGREGAFFDNVANDRIRRYAQTPNTPSSMVGLPGLTVATIHRKRNPSGTDGTYRLGGIIRSGFNSWFMNASDNNANVRKYFWSVYDTTPTQFETDDGATYSTTDTEPHIIIGRWIASTVLDLWLDGEFYTDRAAGAPANMRNDRDEAFQVAGEHTNPQSANEEFFLSVVWNRGLSDTEIREFSNNPWQIFEPHIQHIPIGFIAVAGGSPTASGTPSIDVITASGTATQTQLVSGTPSIDVLTASGVATQTQLVSGTPSIDVLTASGVATLAAFITASGTPSIDVLTASGVATLAAFITASGTPSIDVATAVGVATRGPIIDDVNTTESWNDGDSGLIITGKGFM